MKSDFATLFLLTRAAARGEQVVDPRVLSRVLQFYDRVTPAFAASMLKGWRNGRGHHCRTVWHHHHRVRRCR